MGFKVGQVSVEDGKHSGQLSNSKTAENFENIQNSSMKTIVEQPVSLK
jgi:hypothetical protein